LNTQQGQGSYSQEKSRKKYSFKSSQDKSGKAMKSQEVLLKLEESQEKEFLSVK